MAALRLIFMGTGALAGFSLETLCRQPDLQLVAVVSQPDKPRGRKLQIQPTPVKEIAQARALPVLQPERARDDSFIEQLRLLQPDLIVVVAYGQILPPSILELPRFGCLNVHTSLLPRYRGAAPIQWAILNGDGETGVTIMKMDAGLDTGPILSQTTTPIADADHAQLLHDRLAQLGAKLLVQTIPEYVAGQITPRAQPAEGASYARKIRKEDGLLDWSLPASVSWNRVRGLVPWPGAFTYAPGPAGEGRRLLKVWQCEVDPDSSGAPGTILRANPQGIVVGCGEQALRILQLQWESGRKLAVREFLAGHHLAPGTKLG